MTVIKLIGQKEFSSMAKRLNPKKHLVGYPWTPDTIKSGKKLYTTGVRDCVAGGIVDGSEVKMFHICTRSKKEGINDRVKGFDIKSIERKLFEKINPDSTQIHGFILGGFAPSDNYAGNIRQLEKIKKLFDKRKIPYTVITGRNLDKTMIDEFSVMYNGSRDTWYLTNSALDGKRCSISSGTVSGERYVPKVRTSPIDPCFELKEFKMSAKEYLKNLFEDCSLSQFDTIV